MYPVFVPAPIPVSSRPTHSVVYSRPRYYYYQPHRTTVLVGDLPDDFLRVPILPASSQEEQDRAAAIHLQNQIIAQSRQPQVSGRYEISVVNAVLNKNYGLSRMDPYVRLRIGHHVYETHTAPNGAKNPHWNKTFPIYNLPRGVETLHIEVFDERTLTEDELIAWTHIPIPEGVANGEVIDEWYKLSGKLGEGLEGVIHIVMSYAVGYANPAPPVMMLPGYTSTYPQVPIYTLPPQNFAVQTNYPTPPQGTRINEMFPNMEAEAIKSVLEASNGNKEAAINSLLQME
ncbi:hypothetical protein Anas_09249 [Armadillidium nasatum]|uniref:Toll-interacting protein n=1 Tax=Armadillidium nasatum TaxID=96803 RepID=A0A5N5T8G7_9CRUS|nr:hypothetical protein Anas_09249 [Armadillidium nasatum]